MIEFFMIIHNAPVFLVIWRACALRALGLLLADSAPTVHCSGEGEEFLTGQLIFFTKTAVTPERKVKKSIPRWETNRDAEG